MQAVMRVFDFIITKLVTRKPLESTKFKCSSEWRRIHDDKLAFQRLMKLKSVTENSCLAAIDVMGFHDGSIVLSLQANNSHKALFIAYIEACGFRMNYCDEFYANTPAELNCAVKILEANEIPQNELQLIKRLVTACIEHTK